MNLAECVYVKFTARKKTQILYNRLVSKWAREFKLNAIFYGLNVGGEKIARIFMLANDVRTSMRNKQMVACFLACSIKFVFLEYKNYFRKLQSICSVVIFTCHIHLSRTFPSHFLRALISILNGEYAINRAIKNSVTFNSFMEIIVIENDRTFFIFMANRGNSVLTRAHFNRTRFSHPSTWVCECCVQLVVKYLLLKSFLFVVSIELKWKNCVEKVSVGLRTTQKNVCVPQTARQFEGESI